MLSIRSATDADGEAVRAVGEAAFATLRDVYRPNQAAKKNLAAIEPDLERLVAETPERVVGTVRYRVEGRLLRVMGLAVLPQFQRSGIARQLMAQLTVIGERRGCSALALYTIRETGNVEVFERLGFKVVEERPDRYSISVSGDPLTEAYMEFGIR